MQLGDDELRNIVSRALTLSERLQRHPTGHADTAARVRWERWTHLLGGDDALRSRLSEAAAIDESTAMAALNEELPVAEIPAWALILREILAACDADSSAEPIATARDAAEPPNAARGITIPFERYAARALGETFRGSLHNHLRELLDELASRTARLEAQRHAAERNPLSLKSMSNEEIRAFVDDMLSGGLARLFAEYSVLARLLTTVTTQWIVNTRQLHTRLNDDLEDLTSRFSVREKDAVEVTLGLSDAHNDGQQVARVLFAESIQVLYKPKSLAAERSYLQLVDWLNNRNAPVPFRAPAVVERDGYGWSENIDATDCTSEGAEQRYFERLGAIAAVAFVFGGTDLHVENVIACGEWPVAVDTETFPYPHRRTWADASADELIEESVLRTGVFPAWYPGINGVSKAPLPTIAGARAAAVPNLPSVRNGFVATYQFLIAHREELLAPGGPLSYFDGVAARYIHRATAVYEFLLKRLAYPKYLRQGVDRSIEIEILARPCLPREHRGEGVPWNIFLEEARALENLDIPCFHVESGSGAISVAGMEIVAGAFTHSGMDGARNRVRSLAGSDLALQVRCLEAVVHSASAPVVPPQVELPCSAAENLADAAAEIATELMSQRVGNHGAEWIGLHRVSNNELMRVHVVEDNLYHGRAGIALFLAAQDKANSPHVRRILSNANIGALRDSRIGAASGIGGHVYTLVRIANLLDDEHYLEMATTLAGALSPERISADTAFDITDGAAGAVVGLLALHGITGDETVLNRANACGEHLLHHRVPTAHGTRVWRTLGWPTPHTGMSHGAAGFAMALLRLANATGNTEYRGAALEAIAYERAVFSRDRNNWPDYRGVTSDTQAPTFQSTWCHGATGIGFARLATLESYDTPEVRLEIETALAATRSVTMRDADHVCCGNMGRIEFLFEAGIRLHRPELIVEAQRLAQGVVARARESRTYALYAGVPGASFSLSFFHGIAGIGYSLLRMAYPGRHACVLNWGTSAGATSR